LEIWKKSLQNQESRLRCSTRLDRAVIGRWEDLGITGAFQARDLWAREDMGIFEKRVEVEVQGHGTAMLRLIPYS
jgi:hypothetical protein